MNGNEDVVNFGVTVSEMITIIKSTIKIYIQKKRSLKCSLIRVPDKFLRHEYLSFPLQRYTTKRQVV